MFKFFKFNSTAVVTLSLLMSFGAQAMNFDPNSLDDFEDYEYTAGVLPYFMSKNNNKYVVLSREAHGKSQGEWDAFSGKADQIKNSKSYEKPFNAASREFFEEAILKDTLGWDVKTTSVNVKNNSKLVIGRYNIKTGTKFLYFETQFGFDDVQKLIDTFDNARSQSKSKYSKEKDALIVVKYDDLVNVVKKAFKNGSKTVQLSDLSIAKGKNKKDLIVVAKNAPKIGSTIVIRDMLFGTLGAHHDAKNFGFTFDKKFKDKETGVDVVLYKK